MLLDGAGVEIAGVVSRPLAPAHIIAVASPAYLAGKDLPTDPSELLRLNGIGMRSVHTGRIRSWTMRNVAGQEMVAQTTDTLVMNDPEAMCRSTLLGLGVALIAVPHALPHLESGRLVRVLPQWYADAGPISLYYATRTLLPAKTRVFVEHVVEAFKKQRLAQRFAGSLG